MKSRKEEKLATIETAENYPEIRKKAIVFAARIANWEKMLWVF